MQQSQFGTPEGFDPPAGGVPTWSQSPVPAWTESPAPARVRAPGEEVWSGVDITPQATPPRRRRGRAVAAVVGTTVVVSALAVGGTFAVNALGGGGDRAEQHLPGNTLAMAQIDLDPSLGQKVDAVRFLSRLPEARERVRADSDLREVLYEALTEDVKGAPPWNQAKDWLGDRVAVAALPGTDAKHPVEGVLVIQVSDEQAARDGLTKAAGADNAVSVRDGWAFVARTQQIADGVAATGENASLAADGTFRADLAKLGETGIATGWVDAKAAAAALERVNGDAAGLGAMGGDLRALTSLQSRLAAVRDQLGHGAAAVRFDGPQLEFAMAMTGGRATPDRGPSGIGELPADSIFALSATGLGEAVKAAWPDGEIRELEGFEEELGLELPEDLVALLGDRTQVAVGTLEPEVMMPPVGIRATTSDPRLPNALAAIQAMSQQGLWPIQQQRTKDGYVLSTDATQLKALADGKGGLGTRPGFSSVMPDAATAQTAAWFDLAAYADAMKNLGGDDAGAAEDTKLLKELGAAGLTVRTETDGSARISLRIGVK